MRTIKFRVYSEDEGMIPWERMDSWMMGNLDNGGFMQFTGLLDKNGKEIYEGDILNPFYGSGAGELPSNWLKVVWEHSGFSLRKLDGDGTLFLIDMTTFEIIGNIYESPDLISSIQRQ